ncbi:FecCD family ABC transporter permease [Micromonospora inyonensis]|uniref:Iron complex transport system permease protein n=1 Tax=Micromonospora inyonensis TaxID=47866 RepID=A0A1C6S787_9ACTN|nr:iron chelate uptake ABC transporter family permease subunit [Micromonospora inyonensis]SCL25250.1 iron complex transport system permease protein [Micromonospora inyonensis]
MSVDGKATALVPGAVIRVPGTRASWFVRPRAVLVCLLLSVAVAAAFLLDIAVGELDLPLSDVAAALLAGGDDVTALVVHDLRLPRALVGLLVGAAFGVSGAVFQSLTRNPLASPDVIGVTAGAGTAATAGLLVGAGSGLGLQTVALLGGLGSALLIYLLAWNGGTTGFRIVLVGVGVAALCGSVTTYLLLKAGVYQAQQALMWLTGSLNARGWEHVGPLVVGLAVLAPAVAVLAPWLTGLQLGDAPARALGHPVHLARAALLAVAAALVSVGTAAAGPVAFVALISPQIAVRLVGGPGPALVSSGLVGSVAVLLGDVIAREALPGTELPVGVVTGVLGAPVLLWLLGRANRSGVGG